MAFLLTFLKLFFEGSAWSSFQHAGFSLVEACGAFSVVAALGRLLLQITRSLEHVGSGIKMRGLSSCGVWAYCTPHMGT